MYLPVRYVIMGVQVAAIVRATTVLLSVSAITAIREKTARFRQVCIYDTFTNYRKVLYNVNMFFKPTLLRNLALYLQHAPRTPTVDVQGSCVISATMLPEVALRVILIKYENNITSTS